MIRSGFSNILEPDPASAKFLDPDSDSVNPDPKHWFHGIGHGPQGLWRFFASNPKNFFFIALSVLGSWLTVG
jgi:hypothetical protein